MGFAHFMLIQMFIFFPNTLWHAIAEHKQTQERLISKSDVHLLVMIM